VKREALAELSLKGPRVAHYACSRLYEFVNCAMLFHASAASAVVPAAAARGVRKQLSPAPTSLSGSSVPRTALRPSAWTPRCVASAAAVGATRFNDGPGRVGAAVFTGAKAAKKRSPFLVFFILGAVAGPTLAAIAVALASPLLASGKSMGAPR